MPTKRRTLVLVLAGGAGERLELLTRHRAKPAVPYGGVYRLIDFPLSNCRHAAVSDVWVLQQFNPVSLSDHLANGRPWDLDRTYGGLLVLHPHPGTERGGWHRGTADALWRHADLVRQFAPEVLVVVSADAVYKLDYAELAEEHLAAAADVTMVTTRVDPEDASRYGVVGTDGRGRVTEYIYKPDAPDGDLVSNEVFAFRPGPVLDALEELARDVDEESGLENLGTALLPRLVDAGGVREHRFDGYWRDVGTVPSYWSSHVDLLADEPPIKLDDPSWPIVTHGGLWAPAHVFPAGVVESSLLSPGSRVYGRVERSVLSPGVVVEEGATVRDAVLLHDVVVRSGSTVDHAVVDTSAEIGAGARVGAAAKPGSAGESITLVGHDARVGPDTELPPGARFPEDE